MAIFFNTILNLLEKLANILIGVFYPPCPPSHYVDMWKHCSYLCVYNKLTLTISCVCTCLDILWNFLRHPAADNCQNTKLCILRVFLSLSSQSFNTARSILGGWSLHIHLSVCLSVNQTFQFECDFWNIWWDIKMSFSSSLKILKKGGSTLLK